MSRHDERPNDGQHNERRRRRRRRRHYSGSFFCVSCNWILIALLGEEEDNIICDNYYNSFRDKNEEQRGKRIKITTDQERFFCWDTMFPTTLLYFRRFGRVGGVGWYDESVRVDFFNYAQSESFRKLSFILIKRRLFGHFGLDKETKSMVMMAGDTSEETSEERGNAERIFRQLHVKEKTPIKLGQGTARSIENRNTIRPFN